MNWVVLVSTSLYCTKIPPVVLYTANENESNDWIASDIIVLVLYEKFFDINKIDFYDENINEKFTFGYHDVLLVYIKDLSTWLILF